MRGDVEQLNLGSSLKFCRIAEGGLDLYPRFGPTCEWDTAAGQAILDARALASALLEHDDPVAALAAYESQRLQATTRIVLPNRTNPPDAILREVFVRTGDKPFGKIDDVISREEVAALSEGYKQIAGYSRDALRLR